MTSSDHEEIERLVQQLDNAVSREGAHVRLEQLDGGPEESVVSANRAGYLRFGIELLKAGIAPEPEVTVPETPPASENAEASENGEPPVLRERLSPVDVDLSYLITNDSMVRYTVFQRGNLQVEQTPKKGLPVDRMLTIGCLFLAAIGIFFAVIGFSEVLTWFTTSQATD